MEDGPNNRFRARRMSRLARVGLAGAGLSLVPPLPETAPRRQGTVAEPAATPTAIRRLEYFATIAYDLPYESGWALHPASEAHIREELDGRFPLISRGAARMLITYALDGGTDEDLARAERTAETIADLIGISSYGPAEVEIDRREPIDIPRELVDS